MTQPTTSSENISQDKTLYPRRTERRLQIRANLIRTAAIMFSRNGYSQTTLAEVAEAADVHVQTLYRHFSSKEDLALAAAQTAMDDCRDFFENAGQLSTFATWRRWIEKTVSRLSTLGFDQRKKDQLLGPSSLMNDNYLVMIYSGYENLLTEYLAQEFKLDPEQSRIPRLAACMLCAGNEAAVKRCAGVDTGQDSLADLDSLVKESVGVVDDTQRLFLSLLSEK
jgi:AcrR family transcriptional regulator